jgi:hypothetical protein
VLLQEQLLLIRNSNKHTALRLHRNLMALATYKMQLPGCHKSRTVKQQQQHRNPVCMALPSVQATVSLRQKAVKQAAWLLLQHTSMTLHSS